MADERPIMSQQRQALEAYINPKKKAIADALLAARQRIQKAGKDLPEYLFEPSGGAHASELPPPEKK